MDIDQLSERINDLRNRAWGRGTSPLVNAVLADRVERLWSTWRMVRNDPTHVFTPEAFNNWVDQYNRLSAEVDRELGTITAPAQHKPSWGESLGEAVEDAASIAERTAGAAALAGAAAAIFYFLWGRRR